MFFENCDTPSICVVSHSFLEALRRWSTSDQPRHTGSNILFILVIFIYAFSKQQPHFHLNASKLLELFVYYFFDLWSL